MEYPVRRGGVYYARLNPTEDSEQGGTRPVVVVSRDAINEYSPVVIVVPLTDRKHKSRTYPSQVILKAGDGGLPKESIALGEQLRAISKTRLSRPIGHLAKQSIAAIDSALKIALDLP
jgi:mRNA interferase MazF